MLIQSNRATKTRFAELGILKCTPSLWRIVDITEGLDSGRVIGPHYRSKMELLADLPRYAQEFGCDA